MSLSSATPMTTSIEQSSSAEFRRVHTFRLQDSSFSAATASEDKDNFAACAALLGSGCNLLLLQQLLHLLLQLQLHL